MYSQPIRSNISNNQYLSSVRRECLVPASPWVSFRSLRQMPFHVQGEVVGAGEGALADGTLERFRAGVLAVVAGELVRPRESPLALRPLTCVRLFSYENTDT